MSCYDGYLYTVEIIICLSGLVCHTQSNKPLVSFICIGPGLQAVWFGTHESPQQVPQNRIAECGVTPAVRSTSGCAKAWRKDCTHILQIIDTEQGERQTNRFSFVNQTVYIGGRYC